MCSIGTNRINTWMSIFLFYSYKKAEFSHNLPVINDSDGTVTLLFLFVNRAHTIVTHTSRT